MQLREKGYGVKIEVGYFIELGIVYIPANGTELLNRKATHPCAVVTTTDCQ